MLLTSLTQSGKAAAAAAAVAIAAAAASLAQINPCGLLATSCGGWTLTKCVYTIMTCTVMKVVLDEGMVVCQMHNACKHGS